MNQQPFSLPQLRPVPQRKVRRVINDRKRRRLRPVHAIWNAEDFVGPQHGLPGEAVPFRNPQHRVSYLPASHPRAQRLHHARNLRPRRKRKRRLYLIFPLNL